jgi:hypothetical protein
MIAAFLYRFGFPKRLKSDPSSEFNDPFLRRILDAAGRESI